MSKTHRSKKVSPPPEKRLTLDVFVDMVVEALRVAPGDTLVNELAKKVQLRYLSDEDLQKTVKHAFLKSLNGFNLVVDRGWACEVTCGIDLRLDHRQSSEEEGMVFKPEYLIGCSGSQRDVAATRATASAMADMAAVCEIVEAKTGGYLVVRPYDKKAED